MSTVTDIARHRADRLRVMNAIYEAAEGSPMSHVSGGDPARRQTRQPGIFPDLGDPRRG